METLNHCIFTRSAGSFLPVFNVIIVIFITKVIIEFICNIIALTYYNVEFIFCSEHIYFLSFSHILKIKRPWNDSNVRPSA